MASHSSCRAIEPQPDCEAPSPPPSELALRLTSDVIAARSGDPAAFERLVALTTSMVTAVAIAVLRDRDLGADIVQDVYLAAWRGINKLRRAESFLPWLRQLARNRAREAQRACARNRLYLYSHREDTDELIATAPDPSPSPIEAIVAAEDRAVQRAALSAAIAALPPQSRDVFVLYYGTQHSAREVGRQLELSGDVVRQRLSRARARLRATISPAAVTGAR